MNYVIRRKASNARGGRYFAKPEPVAGLISGARKFATAEDAERDHGQLREPWLWEVLDMQEAARLDGAGLRPIGIDAGWTPKERQGLSRFRMLAALAPGIAMMPPRWRP